MSHPRLPLSKAIIAKDNADDLIAARQWFAEVSNDALWRTWDRIQVMCEDEVDEIISRLAQLKFGELMIDRLTNGPPLEGM